MNVKHLAKSEHSINRNWCHSTKKSCLVQPLCSAHIFVCFCGVEIKYSTA
jgi:hypothetical protein